jgi:hypothetical protein
LEYGLTSNAPAGFAIGGSLISCYFQDPIGYQFCRLAENLHNNVVGIPCYNIPSFRLGMGVGQQYGGNVKELKKNLREGAKYGLKYGEYIFGGYCALNFFISSLLNGENISELLRKGKLYQNVIHIILLIISGSSGLKITLITI